MPTVKGREKGPRNTISVRAGTDIPRLGGVNQQDDPSAINDHEFQRLVNVRHLGTRLIERPGLTKVHTSALTGEVRGVFDPLLHGGGGGDPELQEVVAQDTCVPQTGYGTSGSRLYWIGGSPCTNLSLFHFAPDQSPKVQAIVLPGYQDGANLQSYVRSIWSDGERLWCHASYNGSTSSTFHALQHFVPRNFGIPPVTIMSMYQTETGPQEEPTGSSGQCDFANKHFWSAGGYAQGGGETKVHVYSWDGQTNTLEDTGSLFDASALGSDGLYAASMGVLHEELLWVESVINTTPGSGALAVPRFRKRTQAGVWSTVSLPATVSVFGGSAYDPAVYQGKIYFLGSGVMPGVHATNVGGIALSYDGSTLAVAQNTINSTDGSGSIGLLLRCPIVAGGYLWYLHTPTNQTDKCYVGRFDGSSWSNTYKELTAQFTMSLGLNVKWIKHYQGRLYAAVADQNSSGSPVKLVSAPLASVSGTWSTDATQDSGLMFTRSDAIAAGVDGGFCTAVL